MCNHMHFIASFLPLYGCTTNRIIKEFAARNVVIYFVHFFLKGIIEFNVRTYVLVLWYGNRIRTGNTKSLCLVVC